MASIKGRRLFALLLLAGVLAGGLWLVRQPLRERLVPARPQLDLAEYNRRMRSLAGPAAVAVSTSKQALWPPEAAYPKAGALLPFHRIVAFYGNFHSKQMGILGEYPESEVLRRLRQEAARWRAADPGTPVIPALHYVAVTAQADPGKDRRHRLRMPDSELRQIIAMARKAHGVAFFDIQIGRSSVQTEVARLDKFWRLRRVHIGLDPEFSMKGGAIPGKSIGTMDAAEINWAIAHLSEIVEKYNLPPKILVVHRFVKDMVTHAEAIHPTPQVQVVIDVDGWGAPARKETTYRQCAYKEPVQFTGFKLFFKNDLREPGSHLMSPQEVLSLVPKPIYIQYQ